jgi:predicted transcriptional regulator of viral defense system
MRDAGMIDQLSRGLWRVSGLPLLRHPDLAVVASRVPKAVVCLISALALHGLTDEIPHEVHIMLPRGSRAPRIDHPPVRVFWSSGTMFTDGIERRMTDGVAVRIYSVEKTLADCFKFRNRIGVDVAVEALKRWRTRKGASIATLMRYARASRVDRVMRSYIEATT